MRVVSVINQKGGTGKTTMVMNLAAVAAEHSRVLVMGHSNGGQGSWYLAARYPDRVVAGVWRCAVFL